MEEKQHIGQLFDRIAGTYDGLNHGLSLNIDKRWRRKTVQQMVPAQHVLDVAIGTADLTIEMLRRGKAQQVTGLDLSKQMMAIGKQKVDKWALTTRQSPITDVQFVYGNAQHMPFDDASFDAVTCAYGCRNFQNLDEGLREMFRVLKPGGQVTILEFSYPSNPLVRASYDIYFTHVLPLVGRMVSHDKTAYSYLNKSVKSFCWGEAFAQHMREAGFSDTRFIPLTFGITTIYTATK
ncbi:MAG: bifunctional demethylmenaquinone methyltransferase/2-methoxy-6-polyprenyl-1,4-benzoquinol methylase UbiE [Paludibacteraceae bacterium]|nr:bifunctional demethylmenaquinone methyltransferase/2-methoxy-6-polyprenyl-1,4-benzoquinol methylase UbiE [Paludibacteraceae bacterium]